MARKKVALEYIPTNSTRRETFQRRSRGLMKKAGEVATMCDTNTCIIVYGEGDLVPQVFPSYDEAVAILNRFRSPTRCEKLDNKMDQENFLQTRTHKLRREGLKFKHDCEESENRFLVHKAMLEGHTGLSMEELTNVGYKVEVLLKSISDRIAKIRGEPAVYQPSQANLLTPYVTDSMEIIGSPLQAQASSQRHEEWIELMRSGGGDLNASI